MCLHPPQSLAESHLWVCRCQLLHSQHSLLPDFVPCPLMSGLLRPTSLGLKIWCWHCPCTCPLCSTLEHLLGFFESHWLKGPPQCWTHTPPLSHGRHSWHDFETVCHWLDAPSFYKKLKFVSFLNLALHSVDGYSWILPVAKLREILPVSWSTAISMHNGIVTMHIAHGSIWFF